MSLLILLNSRERERLSKNQEELEDIRQANSDLEFDMQKCHAKENELLEFTRKLTEKNVNLQSDYTALKERVIFWIRFDLLLIYQLAFNWLFLISQVLLMND